jgi:hypothetical protein
MAFSLFIGFAQLIRKMPFWASIYYNKFAQRVRMPLIYAINPGLPK